MRFERCKLLLGFIVAGCLGCGGADSGPPTTSSNATPSFAADTTEEIADAEADAATEEVATVKEGWGNLKGKFLYGGSSQSASRLTITKDPEFCGKHDLIDESVVVSSENGGLANVVVFLYVRRGDTPPETHESYADTASSQVVLDNKQCRFEPHICLLRTSQTLLIKNSDPVGHNTNIATNSNPSFNQTIPTGAELEHKLANAERRPAAVGCNIHPWMKGWILPQETPYFAASGSDGGFEINNIPSGKWTFQVWHETAGSVDDVKINGKATNWSKGRVEVTINGDETTDLGEIKLAAGLFAG